MPVNSGAARLPAGAPAMESLVKEGVAYVRTLHGTTEAPRRIDLDAMLDSIVCDDVDAGKSVEMSRRMPIAVITRPQALRRVVANLVHNALKFGGAAVTDVEEGADGGVRIAVLDRSPGIPEEALDQVFEPFFRVETSRSRHTGGTGLGLAIARQLALALNATLTLHNREGGGLAATLTLKGVR